MNAQPLHEELTRDIEANLIFAKQDLNERKKLLIDKHDWDTNDALKIWCFGPDSTGPNLLVDKTSGIQTD